MQHRLLRRCSREPAAATAHVLQLQMPQNLGTSQKYKHSVHRAKNSTTTTSATNTTDNYETKLT